MALTPEDRLHDLALRLERLAISHEVLVEAATLGDAGVLLPEERAFTADWAETRLAEFRMGRACARRALERLGFGAVSLPIGAGGAPAWPPGVVGSISHKEWACVVAVGRRWRAGTVGVDLELLQPLHDFAEEVCTPCEIQRLAGMTASTKSPLDLIVVAKEAFYKGQYPLTGRELSWRDVEIEVDNKAPIFRVLVAGAEQLNTVGFFAELDPWICAVCVGTPNHR